MPDISVDTAPDSSMETTDPAGRAQAENTGRDLWRPRLTVRRRMEALGWRFVLDEDTCTLEVAKFVHGRTVASSCYDVIYRRDLDSCAAAAEAAGDLMNDSGEPLEA